MCVYAGAHLFNQKLYFCCCIYNIKLLQYEQLPSSFKISSPPSLLSIHNKFFLEQNEKREKGIIPTVQEKERNVVKGRTKYCVLNTKMREKSAKKLKGEKYFSMKGNMIKKASLTTYFYIYILFFDEAEENFSSNEKSWIMMWLN